MNNEKRVLIVEDEPLIAMDIESHFVDNGWTVVGPAGSVEQANDLLENEEFSVGILDINLQNSSSYPIAEKLLARNIPVIFLSGEDGTDRPKEIASAIVVSKPIDYANLQSLVEAEMNRST